MKKFTHTKSGSAGFVPPRRRKGASAAAGGTTKSGRTAPGEKPRVGRISDEAMRDCLAASGVTVSSQVLPRLVTYVHMLMTWNRVMNLVGQETWQDAAGLLVADSFYLAPFLESLPLPGDPRSRRGRRNARHPAAPALAGGKLYHDRKAAEAGHVPDSGLRHPAP